jgi:hypothetical protein
MTIRNGNKELFSDAMPTSFQGKPRNRLVAEFNNIVIQELAPLTIRLDAAEGEAPVEVCTISIPVTQTVRPALEQVPPAEPAE